MSLRQAFSKLFARLTEEEKRRHPEIAEGLGVKQPIPAKQRGAQAKLSSARDASRLDAQVVIKRGSKPAPEKPTTATLPKVLNEPKWGEIPKFTPAPLPTHLATIVPLSPAEGAGSLKYHFESPLESPTPAKYGLATPAFGMRVARNQLQIQIGIDFGTSTTKVMYQVINAPTRVVRPLDLGHGKPGAPGFMIPSLAAFDHKGNLLLGHVAAQALADADWRSGLSHFKMLLAGRADRRYLDSRADEWFKAHVRKATSNESTCTPEALAAAYLAYVMRLARARLAAEFSGFELSLAFNTCVPIDQREKSSVLHLFERVLTTAEHLERSTVTSATARWWTEEAARLLASSVAANEDSRVFVVPESVAGVAAYLTSVQRTDGLHALVDIGSGTTDVSIFHLSTQRGAGPKSIWLSARSIPAGAGLIENEVAATMLRARVSGTPTRSAVLEAMSGGGPFADGCRARVRETLEHLWHRSAKGWADAYGKLGHGSYWNRDSVRIFVAGGGGLVPAARQVFSRAWQNGFGPYRCEVIPSPDDYNAEAAGLPFARLCVAYGLCTPSPELGSYVLPADAPNMTPPPPPHRDYRQDGDQIVPRPGWT